MRTQDGTELGDVSPHHRLPADMNDINAWLDTDLDSLDDYIAELELRATELTPDTFRQLVCEGLLAEYSVPIWCAVLRDAAETPLRRFQFMQIVLQNVEVWPGWDSASSEPEFLDILWTAGSLASELPDDPDLLTSILRDLFLDREIWRFPLVPTAIIASHHLREQDLCSTLEAFLGSWDLSSDTPVWVGSTAFDDDFAEEDLYFTTPLLAICALNPETPIQLLDDLLSVTTFSDDVMFKLAFWEYISACLTDDRVYSGYWDPIDVWGQGFFSNGLAEDGPPMDSQRVLHVLQHFKTYADRLDLENPWGERTLAPQVLTLMANREDVDIETLSDIALNCRWADPVKAAIANPKTPEASRATAALRISH